MEIKLCFQTYEASLTLGADREFRKRRGESLGTAFGKVLAKTAEIVMSEQKGNVWDSMNAVKEVMPFDVALDALDCMTGKTVSKDELEDAMFRVDWMPVDIDEEYIQPWTYTIYKIATELNESYKEIIVKKKQSLDTKSSTSE